jgi:hypothetical protein
VPIRLNSAFHPRLAYCRSFNDDDVDMRRLSIDHTSLVISRCEYDLLGCASGAKGLNVCSGNWRRKDTGKTSALTEVQPAQVLAA